MDFEWDERKNQLNIARHGVSFRFAAQVFDLPVIEFVDDRRNYGETRLIAIGVVAGRETVVVYTMRGDVCRIISARKANRNERRAYRQIHTG